MFTEKNIFGRNGTRFVVRQGIERATDICFFVAVYSPKNLNWPLYIMSEGYKFEGQEPTPGLNEYGPGADLLGETLANDAQMIALTAMKTMKQTGAW